VFPILFTGVLRFTEEKKATDFFALVSSYHGVAERVVCGEIRTRYSEIYKAVDLEMRLKNLLI
jgi:hypothetical protein